MKQIFKLTDIKNNPKKYGLRRTNRVYKAIMNLMKYEEARTGYSDRNTYYVYTQDVVCFLLRVGVSCKYGNDAPKGGACGEWVRLSGQVSRDLKSIHALTFYFTPYLDIMGKICNWK